jgi:hypothetical protein
MFLQRKMMWVSVLFLLGGNRAMTSRVATVAFQGIEAVAVDVQAQFLSGQVQFHIVGLPDKAVAESRERVRAALYAIGLGLPGKRLAINLSPADCPRRAAISICPSHLPCSQHSASSRRTF